MNDVSVKCSNGFQSIPQSEFRSKDIYYALPLMSVRSKIVKMVKPCS